MKKSLLLGLGTIALALGGAAFGLHAANAVETSAYEDGITYYYLTGKFNGEEHWTDYIAAPSDGSHAGVLLNQSLKAGDTFKFKKTGVWTDALDFGDFHDGAGAYQAFYWENGSDNVYCGVDGTYNFYIWEDSGDIKVSVEFADSNTATYSYVLTADSELNRTYMWNGSQKQREWAAAPVVNGQAYDIKFTYATYDYYGLYRIDDRILSGWPNLIMKNSAGTKQSADISRTAGNKQELILCGDSIVTKIASTDEYKAMEYLYDLVTHRGAATYDGVDFAYSICATDTAVAESLVNTYDKTLSSSVKTLLGSAKLNAYNVSGDKAGWGEENKTYVDVSAMVDALRVVAGKKGGSGANRILGGLEKNNNATVLVIVAITSLAAVGIGAGFFFRKRRQN